MLAIWEYDTLPQVVIVIIVFLNYSIKCFSKNRIFSQKRHNTLKVFDILGNILHCHARNDKHNELKKEQESKGKVEKGGMERKCLIRRLELLSPQRVGRGKKPGEAF